jgi:hypothetical protein
MPMEILILAWDRHKQGAEFNPLVISQTSFLIIETPVAMGNWLLLNMI